MKKNFFLFIVSSLTGIGCEELQQECEKSQVNFETEDELSPAEVNEALSVNVETGTEISSEECEVLCETIYGDWTTSIESCDAVWYEDSDSEGDLAATLGIYCLGTAETC